MLLYYDFQISDVIDGKRVLGPPKDIREVQNAYDAYDMLTKLDPYSIADLLTAYKIMMLDLVKEAGNFLWLPIETLIHEQQEEYYEAINAANTDGESTKFVQFMLEIIKQALAELTENVASEAKQNSKSIQNKLLTLLTQNNKISAKDAADKLGMSERQAQRLLRKMKEEGLIERVGANRNGTWKVL